MPSYCKQNRSGSKVIWADVPGYEGLYQASTMGRVRSLDRYVPTGRYRKPTLRKGMILNPKYSWYGYAIVWLCKNGKTKEVPVHRVVLETFVGPCPPGQQCRHLDTNAKNNRLKNLCWGTQQEDWNDRRKHGKVHLGEAHWNNKLTEEQARDIKFGRGKTIKRLAAEHGVSTMTVKNIRGGKAWKWLQP